MYVINSIVSFLGCLANSTGYSTGGVHGAHVNIARDCGNKTRYLGWIVALRGALEKKRKRNLNIL